MSLFPRFKISHLACAAFSLALLASNALATSDSWDQRPSWAADPDAPMPRRSNHSLKQQRFDLSPFAPGTNNFGVDVGQVFLMGDLGANYSDSIGAQLHYTYGVSDLFGFDASVGYSDHSDGKFSMTTALAGLRTNLAWYDKVIPYLVFGMGFYKPSYDTVTLSNSGNATTSSLSPILFGVHLGPGVDLALTRQVYFGTSLTFHDVFGGTRTTPEGIRSVGGTFTSFLLHAGVTF